MKICRRGSIWRYVRDGAFNNGFNDSELGPRFMGRLEDGICHDALVIVVAIKIDVFFFRVGLIVLKSVNDSHDYERIGFQDCFVCESSGTRDDQGGK